MMPATLYSYWRSTAAYRVRLALNLKGIDYTLESVDLHPDRSEQRKAPYSALNPQRLIPFFTDDQVAIGQSMAILEYLEERYPKPALLPEDPQQRGEVRSTCLHIACDVHPLNNVGVLTYLTRELEVSDDDRLRWYAHWIYRAFDSIEKTVAAHGGPFVFGDRLTLADLYLVPQVYNAERFNIALDDYPNIVAVNEHCNTLPDFERARPEHQPDAP